MTPDVNVYCQLEVLYFYPMRDGRIIITLELLIIVMTDRLKDRR